MRSMGSPFVIGVYLTLSITLAEILLALNRHPAARLSGAWPLLTAAITLQSLGNPCWDIDGTLGFRDRRP